MIAVITAIVLAVLPVVALVMRRHLLARTPEFAVGDWVYIVEPGSERGEFYRVTAAEEDTPT
jgi:hypothetical protein